MPVSFQTSVQWKPGDVTFQGYMVEMQLLRTKTWKDIFFGGI